MLKDLRSQRYVAWSLLAQVAAALGRDDDALSWLEQAVTERDPETLYLNVRGSYDSLRSLPAFASIVQRAGLAR